MLLVVTHFREKCVDTQAERMGGLVFILPHSQSQLFSFEPCPLFFFGTCSARDVSSCQRTNYNLFAGDNFVMFYIGMGTRSLVSDRITCKISNVN